MAAGRKTIPLETQLRVWYRDGWTCRYCGDPVFFGPSLKLLNISSPEHGYYHPHGKGDKILSLFQKKWASVDHVIPLSVGGNNSEENYVTACWECNLKWREKTIENGKPVPNKINKNASHVNWDGMASLYVVLDKKEDKVTKILKGLKI